MHNVTDAIELTPEHVSQFNLNLESAGEQQQSSSQSSVPQRSTSFAQAHYHSKFKALRIFLAQWSVELIPVLQGVHYNVNAFLRLLRPKPQQVTAAQMGPS